MINFRIVFCQFRIYRLILHYAFSILHYIAKEVNYELQ